MSANDGEPSPKRQRLESYSPASPPLHDTKHFEGLPPNTPPASVRMSPSCQSQAQYIPTSHGNMAIPSPPSTAGFQSQMASKGPSSEGEGGYSGQATPATETDGDLRPHFTSSADRRPNDDEGMVDAEHRMTDHERHADPSAVPAVELFLLEEAMTPVVPSRPHASQNLMQLYSLEQIQASVARRDAITGEKINKLRKSYENKVKSLNLEGRNRATANLGELAGLVDPGWAMETGNGLTLFQERHQGRELGNAIAESELFSKLDEALTFEPGRLPDKEHDSWKSLLGLDDALTAATAAAPLKTSTFNAAPAVFTRTTSLPPNMARSSAPASPKSSTGRPERSGKKRRYDESSYDGYSYDEEHPLKHQRVRV